jgi:hypothetical protein
MRTQSYLSEMRRDISRFAFSILSGLLLASQLVLPLVAFARSAQTHGNADPPQSLALSEVTVVRLVFDYTAKTASTTTGNPVLCTSLGVLVKSWPAKTASELNSWVLTDGSLLNILPSPCSSANSSSTGNSTTTYTLSTISVYANNDYTGNTLANALLGSYNAVPANAFLCFATPCTNGAFLFAIHTEHVQPTLDMATANTTQQFGIALTNETSATAHPPLPLPGTAAALQFLNPTAVSLAVTNSQNEVGMPIINNAGQMVAMRLQGNILFTSADYNAFVAQRPIFTTAPANPLQLAWESGIAAYYSQHYHDAIKDFQLVESLNPSFKAANTFELKATALSTSQLNSSSGNSVSSTENATVFGIPRSTILIIGIVAGFLLLISFLIIFSMQVWRRREIARFASRRAEEQHNSEREALPQQIAQKQNTSDEIPKRETLLQDNASSGQKVSIVKPQSPANQLCPNCSRTVLAGATYCPNCRYQLSLIARDAPPTLNILPAPELPDVGKALPSSATTSQPQLAPIEETVLGDLAIQEALKRLWDKAERTASKDQH